MTDLFQYNLPPWVAARCGDNWDINLPSEPDASGVGVVATCFAGEDIARLLAAAPELYGALIVARPIIEAERIAVVECATLPPEHDIETLEAGAKPFVDECDAALAKIDAALARIEAGTDETRNAAQPEGREPDQLQKDKP